MPKKFVGSRVFGAESGDRLFLEKKTPDQLTVIYQPAEEKLSESEKYASKTQHASAKRKLLEIDGQKRRLTIFPLNTLAGHPDFLEPKYDQIESIVLEGWGAEILQSEDEVEELLQGLPTGFIKDYSYGLGLVKDYRFIITAVEKIPQIRHLLISSSDETGVSGDTYTLSFDDYEAIRKGLNRITDRQQSDAAQDKRIFAHNSLLTPLDPRNFPESSRPYRKDTIFKLIPSDGSQTIKLSDADQDAAVRLVDQNKREIARKSPQDLLRLRNDIELVSLEVLISKYEDMLGKDLPEPRWQALFNDNPFILNLAFGYPVVKIQDQAHIGGRTLSGSGETIADFLVKNRLSNNAALFEIKKPGTRLLRKTPYREELYAPSSDLAGAMNQMLDQKNEFQKDVARIKENSRIYDLESYSVHGVLVIGTTPEDRHQQKSFELFRGNSKDITIITFNELLGKLKSLHDFLSAHAPEAQQTSRLHTLETKVLKLQREFSDLYTHTESKSGSGRRVTMKPRSGVDGRVAMSTIAKLSVLKTGFDNVRLEKPPYIVAFDPSGEVPVKVDTVDEFISRAEAAIADVEATLALQSPQKQDE
jgi:hypothetical protein